MAVSCEIVAGLQVDLDWWAQNKHAAIQKAVSASLRAIRKKGNLKQHKKRSRAYCEVPVISRYTIVDYEGEVVYDKFVSTERNVWTQRKKNRKLPEHGTPFPEARSEIASILNGCIMVGHGIACNLVALYRGDRPR